MRVDAADVRRVIGEGGNPGIAQRQSDDALTGQIPDVGDSRQRATCGVHTPIAAAGCDAVRLVGGHAHQCDCVPGDLDLRRCLRPRINVVADQVGLTESVGHLRKQGGQLGG